MLRTRIDRLDELLQRHAGVLGADFAGYRNHCYRVVNFAMAFCTSVDEQTVDKLAVAAAFHDLGIWTTGSFDYLDPSERLAREHLRELRREDWSADVVAMIQQHHKIRRCSSASGDMAEVFRKADLVDVSLGVVGFGLSREFRRQVKARFPNAGFHRCLLRLTAARLRSHPLSPLPMMRW
ncbi:HD domain-containing protein [Hydrocarboniphaga sp.]|uniref:HD domain-containing protein n=1 Tax=Hydrocarboniphaga sp. TaxID=2033016 RepID=UPI003D13D0CD